MTDKEFDALVTEAYGWNLPTGPRITRAPGRAQDALLAHLRDLRDFVERLPHGVGNHTAGCRAGVTPRAGDGSPAGTPGDCSCYLATRARLVGP